LSHLNLDFRQTSFDIVSTVRCPVEDLEFMGIQHLKSGYLHACMTPITYVPIRHLYNCRENSTNSPLFLQNKPNFPHISLKNDDFAKKQTQFKPNSNPIKANFSPISRVAKPNKPNSNPIYEKAKNEDKYL